jgi:hypothetical protein
MASVQSISSSPFTDRLCPVCKRILQALPDLALGDGPSPHHSSASDILNTARRGCYICTLLALSIENVEDHVRTTEEEFSFVTVSHDPAAPESYSLGLFTYDENGFESGIYGGFDIVALESGTTRLCPHVCQGI